MNNKQKEENRSPRQRGLGSLSPQDWVDAATEVLVSQNIDAVRVDSLAKQMGLTTGSFYHHFKNRDELLNQVLSNWRFQTVTRVQAYYDKDDISHDEVITALLSLPFHGRTARRNAMIELAIRGWARREEKVREAVHSVDAQRLLLLTNYFLRVGYGKSEAENRAFLLYSFQLAQILIGDATGEAARERQLHYIHELLTIPPRPTGLK